MPNPNLVCEVRTESGIYSDWLTVQLGQSFDGAWQRNFTLTCAEPEDPNSKRRTASGLSWSEAAQRTMRLMPGTRVDIALAGQPFITKGIVGQRQSASDANRHGVQITGFSKAELTQRASAEAGTGQFRGYKLDAIASRLLQPYGLKFRVENGPEGWDTPFPNVVIRHGETAFDAISRLCRQRGLWLRADPNGDVVAGAKPDGGNALFEEGINILSINCSMNWVAAQTVVAEGQVPGSDNLFGRKAAEIGAKSTIQGGDGSAKRRVLAEMPLSQREMQLRTDMEVMAIQASLLRVSLAYQGWLNPNGELWALTDFVSVKSPTHFAGVEGNKLDLKLWGVTYGQTPEGQTTTAIELVNKAAFAMKNPDGQKANDFYNPSTPAQPEAQT